MIIDSDTHISKGAGDFTLESHIEDMTVAGIDKTLCWLSPHHYSDETGVLSGNRYVAAAMDKYPDRIIGFGWADPTFGLETAKAAATQCVEEFGLKGVKMNGAQNNFYIDDPEVGYPLAEHIASLETILAFHIGPDAYERTHPYRAARIAAEFPEMPVLMVHMGMTDKEMNRSVIDAAKRCPNMYLVGSATTDDLILDAVKELGADRVLFGSDRPFRKMMVMKSMYETGLTDELSADEMGLIMGENARKLFGV
jgi:uncharacterized protein